MNESHIEALQRILDGQASSRISELEDLYVAVQEREVERLHAARYRESMESLWREFIRSQDAVLLKRLPTGVVAGGLVVNVLANDTGNPNLMSFLSAGAPVATSNIPGTPPSLTGAVNFAVVSPLEGTNLFYADRGTQGQSQAVATSAALHELIGADDATAQAARFSRVLMAKATVPLKVHTTSTGARKRKDIDSDAPYGGKAKQWEFDAHNVSLNEHLRELKSVVTAVAAGFLPRQTLSPERFVFVSASGATTVLTRDSTAARWASAGGAVTLSLVDGSWDLDGQKCSVNEAHWSPTRVQPLAGVKFGAKGYVYASPGVVLWDTGLKMMFLQRLAADRWEADDGTYLTVAYTPALHCTGVQCQATLRYFDGQQLVDVPESRIAHGLSQSSNAYTDLMETTNRLAVSTERQIFSAFPFQEQQEHDADFVDAVWKGFRDAFARLHLPHGAHLRPSASAATHPITSGCYTLKQAPALGGDAPVVQLSNGVNRWAIGSNATVAADAIVATVVYVRSRLDQGAEW